MLRVEMNKRCLSENYSGARITSLSKRILNAKDALQIPANDLSEFRPFAGTATGFGIPHGEKLYFENHERCLTEKQREAKSFSLYEKGRPLLEEERDDYVGVFYDTNVYSQKKIDVSRTHRKAQMRSELETIGEWENTRRTVFASTDSEESEEGL